MNHGLSQMRIMDIKSNAIFLFLFVLLAAQPLYASNDSDENIIDYIVTSKSQQIEGVEILTTTGEIIGKLGDVLNFDQLSTDICLKVTLTSGSGLRGFTTGLGVEIFLGSSKEPFRVEAPYLMCENDANEKFTLSSYLKSAGQEKSMKVRVYRSFGRVEESNTLDEKVYFFKTISSRSKSKSSVISMKRLALVQAYVPKQDAFRIEISNGDIVELGKFFEQRPELMVKCEAQDSHPSRQLDKARPLGYARVDRGETRTMTKSFPLSILASFEGSPEPDEVNVSFGQEETEQDDAIHAETKDQFRSEKYLETPGPKIVTFEVMQGGQLVYSETFHFTIADNCYLELSDDGER